MSKFRWIISIAALALMLSGCDQEKTDKQPSTEKKPTVQATPEQTTNPLLAKYSGPYGGVPAFDKMQLQYLQPALEKGMEINLKEIDAIANNPEAPSFENTIAALERAGQGPYSPIKALLAMVQP